MRVLLVSVLLTLGTMGAGGRVEAAGAPPATTDAPPSTVPEPTINEFLPEERAIGDCISAVPKPGCGSESRSDWRQWLVFAVLAGGLAFVGWRVVVGLRRAGQEQKQHESATS